MQPAIKEATDARLAGLSLPEGGGWLGEARQCALDMLTEMGLPGRRDEYWRYTDPARLNAASPQAGGAEGENPFVGIDVCTITIGADGITVGDLPDGVDVATLSDSGGADIHWAKGLYGRLGAPANDPVARPFAVLNAAFASDGVLLHATGEVATPIHIHYADQGDALLHHVVKVDPGASVTLIETGHPGPRFNTVTEVEIGANAAFHHLRVQGRGEDRHANTHLFAELGARAAFRSFTLGQNGSFTRNEAVIALTGDEASAHIGTAVIGSHKDVHHDDTVFITHDAVNCESRQVFKKVLRDGATGVFQGKILVREGAQKTDGYQISQSLLLDDDAQFLAKPELEIYADDVACSHGSTTGAIDETALFYLRSRGVPAKEATDLLVLSFLAEAVEEIEDETLAERVTDTLAEWLRG